MKFELFPTILIIVGVCAFVYGILKVSGVKKENIDKDSELDKKWFSERDRYLLGRYLGGFQGIIGGLGAIGLGLILYFD